MKKLITFFIAVSLLCFPVIAMTECPDPTGATYQENNMVLYFTTGYGQDRIVQVYTSSNTYYIHYAWNEKICRATLDLDPPVYLDFDESWVDLSTMPRFQIVGTVD
jgi:hypothetical protein